MYRCWLLACLTVFLFSCSPEEKRIAPPDSSQINSLLLKSIGGNIIAMNDLLKHHRATVIYFLMPGCPMCESYTLTINELSKKFSGKEISFGAVFSSPDYTDEEIISFHDTYNLAIPFYRDSSFNLTRMLGAKVTPEVFVLDSAATLLYSGSIDNWAYATGKIRMEATEFFLNDALENIVNGKPVSVKHTAAYGCLIE